MKKYKSETLNEFVEYSYILTNFERTKIADIIQNWEIISTEKTSLNKHYLDILNTVISDTKINDIIKTNPELKEEIISRLIKLLESVNLNIKDIKDNKERIIFNDFKAKCKDFSKFFSTKNIYSNHIKETYLKRELSLIDYKKELNNILKNKENYNKKINSITDKISERNKELEKVEKLIKEENKKNPIKAKVDLKTLKPIKNYKVPETKILKELKEKEKNIKQNIDKFNLNLKDLKKSEKENVDTKQKIKILRQSFENNWEKLINTKELEKQIRVIDKLRKYFLKELYKKIDKFKEMMALLKPFISDISDAGRLWSLGGGNWQNIDFSLLQHYAEIVKNKKGIIELANMLGRLRKAEVEYKEEEYSQTVVLNSFKINHSGKSEIIGITESNDIKNILPVETLSLTDKNTEMLFYKKFAESKLQTYDFISKEADNKTTSVKNKRKVRVEKDKGPFIIAVDTSGSMHGAPEELAKSIAFAITKIGLEQNRKAYLITFSTGINTFELTDINKSLSKLIEFLQMSFHGGTDVSMAVNKSVEMMKTNSYEKADLLIITDGIFARPNIRIIADINKLKEKGNKFNTLIIGNSYNNNAIDFCDNTWSFNPNSESLLPLVKEMQLA